MKIINAIVKVLFILALLMAIGLLAQGYYTCSKIKKAYREEANYYMEASYDCYQNKGE